MTPLFYASTVAAGLMVGAVNHALARLVVGRRIRLLAERMSTVESRLAQAVFTHDWSGCDPESCALPVDSQDEVGASAAAFNRLIETLGRSHDVETAMRAFSEVLASRFELDSLGNSALDALLVSTGAEAGALLVARDNDLEPIASHGLRTTDGLATNDHVRRVVRLGRTERLTVTSWEMIVDSLLVGQPAREILVAPVSFKSVPLGAIVLATSSRFVPEDAEWAFSPDSWGELLAETRQAEPAVVGVGERVDRGEALKPLVGKSVVDGEPEFGPKLLQQLVGQRTRDATGSSWSERLGVRPAAPRRDARDQFSVGRPAGLI